MDVVGLKLSNVFGAVHPDEGPTAVFQAVLVLPAVGGAIGPTLNAIARPGLGGFLAFKGQAFSAQK